MTTFRHCLWPHLAWTGTMASMLKPKGAWWTRTTRWDRWCTRPAPWVQRHAGGEWYPGNGYGTTVRPQVVHRGTPPGTLRVPFLMIFVDFGPFSDDFRRFRTIFDRFRTIFDEFRTDFDQFDQKMGQQDSGRRECGQQWCHCSGVINGVISGVINPCFLVLGQNRHFDPRKRAISLILVKTEKYQKFTKIRVLSQD